MLYAGDGSSPDANKVLMLFCTFFHVAGVQCERLKDIHMCIVLALSIMVPTKSMETAKPERCLGAFNLAACHCSS